ncbi:MAG: hypothetical protein PVJ86_07680 [Phycisphaerales bacterium]
MKSQKVIRRTYFVPPSGKRVSMRYLMGLAEGLGRKVVSIRMRKYHGQEKSASAMVEIISEREEMLPNA